MTLYGLCNASSKNWLVWEYLLISSRWSRWVGGISRRKTICTRRITQKRSRLNGKWGDFYQPVEFNLPAQNIFLTFSRMNPSWCSWCRRLIFPGEIYVILHSLCVLHFCNTMDRLKWNKSVSPSWCSYTIREVWFWLLRVDLKCLCWCWHCLMGLLRNAIPDGNWQHFLVIKAIPAHH